MSTGGPAYPGDWPRCDCGDAVLDGHLTCGRAQCGTQREAQHRRRLALVVYLVDGRAIDLSGLSAREAIARFDELGLTHEQILETVHLVTRQIQERPS